MSLNSPFGTSRKSLSVKWDSPIGHWAIGLPKMAQTNYSFSRPIHDRAGGNGGGGAGSSKAAGQHGGPEKGDNGQPRKANYHQAL